MGLFSEIMFLQVFDIIVAVAVSPLINLLLNREIRHLTDYLL